MAKRYELDTLPRKHHTLKVVSTHLIGADRLPIFSHTEQRIEALEPIDHIPFVHDAATVSIQTFGSCTAGERYEVGDNFFGVDLTLPQPLDTGQRADLNYTAWFEYATAPPPEFRRQVGSRALELLDLTIQFDTGRSPAELWWTKWDDPSPGSEPIAESMEPVELVPPPPELELPDILEANRRIENVPAGTIIGFVWKYPE